MTDEAPFHRWYDGAFYAATVDRALGGVRGFLVTHLPPGPRVLDVACGTGALALDLAAAGRTVVGVDLSDRQIAFARSRAAESGAENVAFEVADATTLEAPEEGPFDHAVVVLALHEMPQEVRLGVLRALAGAARRSTLVDFSVPMPWNLAGVRNRLTEASAGRAHLGAYRDFQRRGGLASLVQEASLVVEHERAIDAGTMHVVQVTADDGDAHVQR